MPPAGLKPPDRGTAGQGRRGHLASRRLDWHACSDVERADRDPRDVPTVMVMLADIRDETQRIRRLLEDDDGETEEEADDLDG